VSFIAWASVFAKGDVQYLVGTAGDLSIPYPEYQGKHRRPHGPFSPPSQSILDSWAREHRACMNLCYIGPCSEEVRQMPLQSQRRVEQLRSSVKHSAGWAA
jgi:hypothetical protein